MILKSPDMSDLMPSEYLYTTQPYHLMYTINAIGVNYSIANYLLVSMVKRNKYSEKVMIPGDQAKSCY